MIHWKRLFVLLCVLAALELTACGQATSAPAQESTETSTEGTPAPTGAVTEATQNPTTESTAEPAPIRCIESPSKGDTSDKFTQVDHSDLTVVVSLPAQKVAKICQRPFDLSITKDTNIRPIIYLTAEDASGTPIYDFDPPMELTIQYTKDDVEKLADNNAEKLVVVMYDQSKNEWENLTTRVDTKNMTVSVSVSHWTSHLGFR